MEKEINSQEVKLKNFRLSIAYRGTNYHGWQKQAISEGPDTVQEIIEAAARKILKKERVIIHGSGRTDAGVHARSQVAHMKVETDYTASALIKAINAHLPDDIRIIKMEECNLDFHSQLGAKKKTYRYFILNTHTKKDPIHWPFLRPYTWYVSYPLNYDEMKSALYFLKGTHDFRSFQNTGTPLEDTVREILKAELQIHEPNSQSFPWMPSADFPATLLEIQITGTGFLKQMVRTIAGTIVEVGRGRLKAEQIPLILNSKDRKLSGMTAPANGLFLDHVEY
ncbi:MAG: tRNA pseudouridine(38-40) synthase TruA [Oligoflexia bacterium]|nr:tRNA pseudouridine(38-40) synthase TruA [Oligoflexia bacterium]